jgi:site-specific recombinase XerD
VLPQFKKTKLMQITPRQIESWIMELFGEGRLSPATVNRVLGTLKVMLSEAVRLQLIPMNPASPVGDLKEKPKERGVLPMEFVKRLFAPENAEEFWHDPKHYTVNLLAASAGLRLGECQALMIKNVGAGFVRVMHSYDDRHGIQQPKWNSCREVPTPKIADESLH